MVPVTAIILLGTLNVFCVILGSFTHYSILYAKLSKYLSLISNFRFADLLWISEGHVHPLINYWYILFWKRVQFSENLHRLKSWWKTFTVVAVVQSFSHVRLFVTPWIAACQASLSLTISQSLLKLMPIESEMPSNHLIHRNGNSTSTFIVQANDYFLRLFSRLILCVPAMSFPWRRVLTLYSTDFMLPWVLPPSLKYLKQESMWILRDKIVSKKYTSTFDEHDCVS